jgi:hypothetical protein
MAALRRMRPRDRGTIVQVGSALAYRAIPLQSPYCGAKHAIRGFTDSIRCELLHDGSNVHITMVQLPALNTPQFDWCRNKLPRESQPVPPIYQPEVAARGIAFAARSRRREVNVGLTSVVTIWGNKFLPWLADRYLARNGYRSQQTETLLDPKRPDNLFEPVPGDYAAHGRFDARAQSHDIQLTQTKHRGAVLAGTLLIAGMLGGYLAAR